MKHKCNVEHNKGNFTVKQFDGVHLIKVEILGNKFGKLVAIFIKWRNEMPSAFGRQYSLVLSTWNISPTEND